MGDALTVVAPAGSSARVFHVNETIDSTVSGATSTFGPYGAVRTLHLRCTAGAVDWSQPSQLPVNAASVVVSSAAPVDADGRPDGTIYIQTA
ncbi:hypothetical protein A9977_05480 [Variovorax sp. UMC13]|nr:hypothetical protein [Variovorax sp. UMC13]